MEWASGRYAARCARRAPPTRQLLLLPALTLMCRHLSAEPPPMTSLRRLQGNASLLAACRWWAVRVLCVAHRHAGRPLKSMCVQKSCVRQ